VGKGYFHCQTKGPDGLRLASSCKPPHCLQDRRI